MNGHAAAGSAGLVVVAGYGNPLRGDDGAGYRLALEARERYRGRPDVAVLVGHQPVPEWAEVLAGVAVAYLVDATPAGEGGAAGGVRLVRLTDGSGDPPPDNRQATSPSLLDGHALGPAALLALCREAYGRAPEAFLLTIPAVRLDFADRLTAPAAAAVDEALHLLDRLLEPARTPEQAHTAEADTCA
jgi:hydrogenase maturation protease